MKTKSYLTVIEGLLFAAIIVSCTPKVEKGFTEQERQLISLDGTTAMHALKCTDERELQLLRAQSLPIDKEMVESEYFKILCDRMFKQFSIDSALVGIAAPQVGISRRLIAVVRCDREGEPTVFYVNPQIIYSSPEKQLHAEGCLSVPDRREIIERSSQIVVRYNSVANGFEERQDTVSGFTAIIFQHEIDHLNGKLFTDYVGDKQQ